MTRLATVINKIIDIINTKQPILVSGENIKSIKNESVIGEGDIDIKDVNGESILGEGDLETIGTGELSTESQNIIGAINELDSDIGSLNTRVTQAEAAVGAPRVASTVASMTDTTKVYVYTGSETGYTAGNWYYYDGSAWVSGGVYNSFALETDTTLTEAGKAADAKSVGDELTDVKSELANIAYTVPGKNLFDPSLILDHKYLELDGRITDYDPTAVTDFMPVTVGKYVTFSYKTSSGRAAYSANTLLFFDVNQEKITSSGASYVNNKIVPDGASYVRVTFGRTIEDLQIELTDDGIFTDYVPYRDPSYKLDTDIIIPADQVTGISDAIDTATVKGYNIVPVSEDGVGAYYVSGSTIVFDDSSNLHYVIADVKPNTRYYANKVARFFFLTDDDGNVQTGSYKAFSHDFFFETGNATKVYYTVEVDQWINGLIIAEGYQGTSRNALKPAFVSGLNQLMDDSWLAVAMPPKIIRFTVGISEKLYFYNILALEKNMIDISINGANADDGVVVTPTTAVTDSNVYGFTVYDDNLSVVANAPRGGRNRLTICNDNVSNCSALIIGDSIVARNNAKIGQTLLDAFTERGKTITLLGTLGSGDNKNEGRPGWTASDYFTDKQYEGVTNPFYNPTSETFDFSYYMTNQNYSSVDYVILHLGGNDLFSVSFADARERITQTENYLFSMIDSILSWNANQKIIVQLLPTTSPKVEDMNVVGGNAKLIRAKFVNYNAEMLVLLSKYGDKVRCSNDYMIVDPESDLADHIHPNDTGLTKIGMELLSQINCWQNS